jgi:lysozyme family protein
MTFDEIIHRLIKREGGYVNDPDDAGGETKFGISKRQYPHLDIESLTAAQAHEIYRRDYWDRHKVSHLPASIREIYFDMCVLQGVKTATRILQKAINHSGEVAPLLVEDGILGPITRSKSHHAEPIILRAFRVEALNFIVLHKPSQRKFWKGWMTRAVEV